MGKSKNNNRSEIEYLRGENKRLRKRLREAEKQHRNVTEEVDEIEENEDNTFTTSERKEICEDCGKGEVKTVDLGIRIIKECLLCGHREVYNGKEKKSP